MHRWILNEQNDPQSFAFTLVMGRSRKIRSERTNPEGERQEPIPKTRELIIYSFF